MDVLISFPNTLSVLQAEQILIRHRIPFETVPRSRFDRELCGLGILFSDVYFDAARQALDAAQLQAEFTYLEK